ncbi:hypothetical protein HWV62_2854 [Athelia sp. TMB]|nr:hypothetical protein HWV62_2854 [Athelia sp. TMB]
MNPITRTLSRLNLLPRGKSRRSMTLPAELWICIFDAVTLDRKDIFRIRLTCRAFSRLARPMAFRYFTFRESADANRCAAARLTFFASQAIAPSVRECAIYCKIDQDSNPLHDMFFINLPKFINLSSLRCEGLPFNDFALGQLPSLPKLRAIALIDCNVILEKAPPTISITDVQFGSNVVRGLRRSVHRGTYGWIDVLCPDSIRTLTLRFSAAGPWSLRGILSQTSPNLPGGQECFKRHLELLISHPKNLRSLTISSFLHHPTAFNHFDFHVFLPSLHTYNGISSFLQCFTPSSELRSLTLRNYTNRGTETLRETSNIFDIHPHAHVVRELGIELLELSEIILHRISAEYPGVRILSIMTERITEEVSHNSYTSLI